MEGVNCAPTLSMICVFCASTKWKLYIQLSFVYTVIWSVLLIPANYRLNNFELSVSDDNVSYTDCASYPNDTYPDPSVTLTCDTTGRYVRFQKMGTSGLTGDDVGLVTLCEVVIIGYKLIGTPCVFNNLRLKITRVHVRNASTHMLQMLYKFTFFHMKYQLI